MNQHYAQLIHILTNSFSFITFFLVYHHNLIDLALLVWRIAQTVQPLIIALPVMLATI